MPTIMESNVDMIYLDDISQRIGGNAGVAEDDLLLSPTLSSSISPARSRIEPEHLREPHISSPSLKVQPALSRIESNPTQNDGYRRYFSGTMHFDFCRKMKAIENFWKCTYQKVLQEESGMPQPNADRAPDYLLATINHNLKLVNEQRWKIRVNNTIVGVKTALNSVAKAAQYVQFFVVSVVSGEPHEAMAWARLIINASEQPESLIKGVEYISEILCRFSVIERLYREQINLFPYKGDCRKAQAQPRSADRAAPNRSRECLHSKFYVSAYAKQMNRNPDAVEGTCRWLLDNSNFQHWKNSSFTMLRRIYLSCSEGGGKKNRQNTCPFPFLMPPRTTRWLGMLPEAGGLLVEYGAGKQDRYREALSRAVFWGSNDLVRLFGDSCGADVKGALNGLSVLCSIVTCSGCDEPILSYLFKKGVRPNGLPENVMTSLESTTVTCSLSMVKALLENGPDVNLSESLNLGSPLYQAFQFQPYGSEIDGIDEYDTLLQALHMNWGKDCLIKMLVTAGAEVNDWIDSELEGLSAYNDREEKREALGICIDTGLNLEKMARSKAQLALIIRYLKSLTEYYGRKRI
ncbi:hypothetical protein NHQ30_003015 [Ciborinia camelliae]|nr:hypothetical protein NHQ30_003015 [Ciborinia camelliae]